MAFSTTPPRNDYVGNGSTATYAYGFRIFAGADLKVTVQDLVGVETTLLYLTDFTVTGINSPNGGTITITKTSLLSGGFFLSGYKLSIRFFETTSQPVDLRNQGAFFLEVIEDLFDRVVRFVQQGEDKINRSLHIPETEAPSETATLLPTVTNRGSKFLAFDASGNPIATAGGLTSPPVTAFMATVLDDTTGAAALQTIVTSATPAVARKTLGAIGIGKFHALNNGSPAH